MPAASIIMGIVALLAGIGGFVVFGRRTPSEASVYRHRIAGTVLLALSASLAIYAFALHGWEATR